MVLSPKTRLERKAHGYIVQFCSYVLIVVALAIASFFKDHNALQRKEVLAAEKPQVTQTLESAADGLAVVTRVIDGDTFELENNQKVRLIGIDTPESRLNQKAKRDSARSTQDVSVIVGQGKQAKEFVKGMLEGKKVRLEYDVGKADRYGRVLAYAYLEDGTFVNAHIIKEGYASVLTVPPNVKYVELFQRLYEEARSQNRGLWKIINNL